MPVNDPALLIPAMAYVTEHLGFAYTSSVLQAPPSRLHVRSRHWTILRVAGWLGTS